MSIFFSKFIAKLFQGLSYAFMFNIFGLIQSLQHRNEDHVVVVYYNHEVSFSSKYSCKIIHFCGAYSDA